MLEAKRVTPDGYAFSLATEFIENLDPAATKQDCELKAFARLAETLKRHFPQLPLLLLGDALYANQTVFEICRANDWRFIFTFKAGSLPALFADYETLRDLEPQNRVERREGPVLQRFAWVNDLKVGCASVVTLANRGGRLRWKIEKEGFNIQKNGGYELEHAYSQNENAGKSFYFLLQVAHALRLLPETFRPFVATVAR